MSDEEQNIIINMGAPEWVVTFGDLMSLLLCFFVLLLSFSEMDKAKYKEVAGSLEKAFGVSYQSKSMTPPKGVTIVAKDFDQPLVPTFVKDEYVKMGKKDTKDKAASKIGKSDIRKNDLFDKTKMKNQLAGVEFMESGINREEFFDKARMKEYGEALGAELKEKIEEILEEMEEKMQDKGEASGEMESMKDLIGVEVGESEVTIRMMGETAFDSGKADIRNEMIPILKMVAAVLKEQKGEVIVVGHTDNVPIVGGIHKTNLGLSMARAASVADYLLNRGGLAPNRVSTMGFGEHRPIETNETPEGRQRNRRVEIKLKSTPEDIKNAEDYIKKPKIFLNGSSVRESLN